MIVYLDIVMLTDFLVTFFFFLFIEYVFHGSPSIRNSLISSLVSSALIYLSFYNILIMRLSRYLGGFLLGNISFHKSKAKERIVKITTFYALNFGFVGFLNTFQVNTSLTLIIALISTFLIFLISSKKKYFIFRNQLKYNVMIKINQKIINLKGFLDTGNMSKYLNIPIIYVNDKYQEDNYHKPDYFISVNTVTGTNIQEGYKPEIFTIEYQNQKIRVAKKVIIIFCKLDYDCLLNPLLLI